MTAPADDRRIFRGRSALTALKAAVSLAALIWVIHKFGGLEADKAAAALAQLSIPLLALTLVCTLANYALRLFRLALWVKHFTSRDLRLNHWLDLYLKSAALGSLTPARLGDFSRIFLLAPTGISLPERTKLVLLDRLTDLLYVPLALLLAVPLLHGSFRLPWAAVFSAAALLLALYLAAALICGLRRIPRQRVLAGWLATIFAFLFFALSNMYLFHAAGVMLPFALIVAVVVLVGLLANLPISVGGLGVREAGITAALEKLGVPPEKIAMVVLLEFLLNIVFPPLLFLIWTGLSKRKRA